MGRSVYFLHDVAGFLKNAFSGFQVFRFSGHYSPFVNGINAGRHRCCGIEERTVVAYGCRKTKKVIFGMEGENVLAYNHLPSHALNIKSFSLFIGAPWPLQ